MFELATSELLLIAIVALIVIGPKELPNALKQMGRAAGKARAMSRHLRAGFDEMVRQAELEEMEKEWRAHNARVMAGAAGAPGWPEPATEAPADPMAAPTPPPAEPERLPGEPAPPPRPGPLP